MKIDTQSAALKSTYFSSGKDSIAEENKFSFNQDDSIQISQEAINSYSSATSTSFTGEPINDNVVPVKPP